MTLPPKQCATAPDFDMIRVVPNDWSSLEIIDRRVEHLKIFGARDSSQFTAAAGCGTRNVVVIAYA
jgi:hypothetical protein